MTSSPDGVDMKELVDIMEEVKAVAKDAGAFIREQRESFDLSRVEAKGAHDYVSYVDKETERLIVSRLKQIVPEAGFITEEGTASNPSNPSNLPNLSGTGELTWIVDPLDGTSNFVHDMAPYCVAIALKSGEEIVLGVVYEVVGDELFYTCKGEKSYKNGKEIHVGQAKVVNDAFICIGYPYNVEAWKPKVKGLVDELYGNSISIRNLGSAETELCYVACGRFDAYIESYVKPWDVSAGGIILMNAGGCVTDYEGGKKWMTGEETLATNGFIHDELLTKLKDILTD